MSKEVNRVILASSLLSIAASIYLFVSGKKETGIFIGLWAPTFLGLGSFLNATQAAEEAAATTALTNAAS